MTAVTALATVAAVGLSKAADTDAASLTPMA